LIALHNVTDSSKLDAMITELRVTPESPKDRRRMVLESVTLVMFGSITGYTTRYLHNSFMATDRAGTKYGPLVFIDNDRALFSYPTSGSPIDIAACHSFVTRLCRFPRTIALRIMMLAPEPPAALQELVDRSELLLSVYSQAFTLGNMLLNTTKVYGRGSGNTRYQPSFTCDEARVVDQNVQFWADAISHCVALYGAENVLLPEPWDRHEYSASSFETLFRLKRTRASKRA